LGRLAAISFLLGALLSPAARAGEAKPQKLTFEFGGAQRTYYLFIPDKPGGSPMPLLLLLHGSGHNGKSLIDPWLSMAKAEGIILVAPDASNPQAWRIPEEGPDFFHELLEAIRAAHAEVDARRMYIFGHSAGAIHGLDLGLLESEYFAAVAVHAGAISPEMASVIDLAPRKTPMAIWVGTNDAFFPLSVVRQTRDTLNAHGFDVRLTEIRGHTHDYYGSASAINNEAWAFLQPKKLTDEPKFQQYQLVK
jgi:predicted esterase